MAYFDIGREHILDRQNIYRWYRYRHKILKSVTLVLRTTPAVIPPIKVTLKSLTVRKHVQVGWLIARRSERPWWILTPATSALETLMYQCREKAPTLTSPYANIEFRVDSEKFHRRPNNRANNFTSTELSQRDHDSRWHEGLTAQKNDITVHYGAKHEQIRTKPPSRHGDAANCEVYFTCLSYQDLTGVARNLRACWD